PRPPADVGEQEASGEAEEAETAAGAVNSQRPARRSIGPPHLHLRRHHGWYIELLFKRGKGQLGWSFSHGRTGDRVLTEVLAEVLGAAVVLWSALLHGGPLEGRSPAKRWAAVRAYALRL